MGQGDTAPGGSGENASCLLQPLTPQQSWALFDHITSVSAFVLTWSSSVSQCPFSYKDMNHWPRAHPTEAGPPLNLAKSAKTLFPVSSRSQVPGRHNSASCGWLSFFLSTSLRHSLFPILPNSYFTQVSMGLPRTLGRSCHATNFVSWLH